MRSKILISAVAFAAVLCVLGSCTNDEELPLPIVASLSGNNIFISDVKGIPDEVVFDNVRVSLTGFDWQVIGTVRAEYKDGKAVLILPAEIPAKDLCKVARDNMHDYEGHWPAEEVSDRSALVASFEGNNIIAYMGDTPVGRLSLTDWEGDGNVECKYFVYYIYSDRPYSLSGYNLTVRPEQRKSFEYEASFKTGWTAYANINRGVIGSPAAARPSLCTTDIPSNLPLRWRFEKW